MGKLEREVKILGINKNEVKKNFREIRGRKDRRVLTKNLCI